MNDGVIAAARSHWLLGEAPITLVWARENQVYRVDRNDGPVALRLHRPGYRSADEINAELQWMAMLSEHGVSVPAPVAGMDGSYIQTFNGCTVSLLSWIDGTPHSKMTATPDMYFALGRELARMHALADSWHLPAGFSRPTWDLIGDNPSWDRFWENPSLNAQQRGRFLAFRDHAREAVKSFEPLDFGLIHADLVPDNVLSNGEQISVIDFDDGGFGYRLFDLATITFQSKQKFDSDEFAQAVIDGYCTSRSFPLESLMLFEAMRACSYVGWNISRMQETEAGARNVRFIQAAEIAVESVLDC